MNIAKISGSGLIVASQLKFTSQDWILIIGIVVTVLGMIQEYLVNKDRSSS